MNWQNGLFVIFRSNVLRITFYVTEQLLLSYLRTTVAALSCAVTCEMEALTACSVQKNIYTDVCRCIKRLLPFHLVLAFSLFSQQTFFVTKVKTVSVATPCSVLTYENNCSGPYLAKWGPSTHYKTFKITRKLTQFTTTCVIV